MAGNCQMAMAMKPAASARTDLSSLAQTKLLLFSARRGRHAWPSWDMELASRTEKGSIPDANMVTNTICGPDCGISPMITAMNTIRAVLPLIQVSMSIYIDKMPADDMVPDMLLEKMHCAVSFAFRMYVSLM